MKRASVIKILKNGLLLSAVSYVLYIIIWLVLDEETLIQLQEISLADHFVDFLLCVVFTYTSLGFCSVLFRAFPFKATHVRVIVYASCLLVLNNLVAFGMCSLFNMLWSEGGTSIVDELVDMKNAYTFAMMATFISSVYANTFYLQSYIKARDEKQAVELALVKEKEVALQSQLNSLKLQINPHFMFNNFNNLLELIEEDTSLAEKFLSNLSKVYRYIIANLDRNLISIAEEMKFLDSYLFLMNVRHGGAVVTQIGAEVKEATGFLPPAVLQLLVENAIKHNSFSTDHTLVITISYAAGYVMVSNPKAPLLSKIESTGLGLKNIVERYALLCDKKVLIDNNADCYSVSLPIIENITDHENIDS